MVQEITIEILKWRVDFSRILLKLLFLDSPVKYELLQFSLVATFYIYEGKCICSQVRKEKRHFEKKSNV